VGRVLLFTGAIFLANGYCFSQDTRVPIDRGIKKETFTYAKKDTSVLQLDVYTHPSTPKNSPCIIFVFGGGFFTGKRDEEYYNKYFNSLVHEKYVVVSISYRLGIHGMQKLFTSKFKPLRGAIDTAVVDLYDATNWVIKHRKTIGIDTTKIILSGSSAGAIVVLQSDFEKRNKTKLSRRLSRDFQYAGVISFAGAILSYRGPLRYRERPAPTLMFHGTHDKMVIYRQVAFFNRSLSGSYSIAKTFRKFRYPYYFYKVRGMGHEIAAYPMHDNFKQIAWFINELVLKKKRYQVEESFNNLDKKRGLILSAEDIYKEDNKK
jgi:dipeptidyl aminopeptidase/acylaminoacyl peptidase